jgi:hypothetical protein
MASRLMAPQPQQTGIQRGAETNPRFTPPQLRAPSSGQAPVAGRVSPVNPYTNPSAGYGGAMDPGKEFGRGYMADLVNMLGTHDMSSFQSGPQRHRYAQAYNAGQTKPQMDYNKMQYERQNKEFDREISAKAAQKENDEADWEKKMLAKSYIDAFRGGDFTGSMAQWASMTPADRSKIMLPDEYQGRDAMTNVQSVFTLPNGNKAAVLRNGTVKDLGVKAAPPKTEITTEGGVAYVKSTLPGGEVKMTPLDEYQSDYRQQQKAGEKTATDTAGVNVKMKTTLATSLDSLEKQIDAMYRLRDIVQEGPETGRMEQYGAAWDAEKQALEGMFLAGAWNKVIDMKDQGMTFGNFTDTEFTRIAKTLGEVGDKKEANLAKITNAIKELESNHELFFDRWENPEGFLERKRQRRVHGQYKKADKTDARTTYEKMKAAQAGN